MRLAALLLSLFITSAVAQQFEVVSIRVAVDDGHHGQDTDKGLWRTQNFSLKRLIASAYKVDLRQVSGGPQWADKQGFDISARVPREFVSTQEGYIPLMVQNMLADRFQLVISRQKKQISGYALVVAKKGLKLTAEPSGAEEDGVSSHNTHIEAKNATMSRLADHLSRDHDIGAVVVDRTGNAGKFTFTVDWKPDAAKTDDDDRPSIFRALEEQLGLRLEAAKIDVDAIVIERAEKPGEN